MKKLRFFYILLLAFVMGGCDPLVTSIPVCSVTLDISTLTLIASGEKATITVVIDPSNATDSSVTWSSSNESVATVSTSGVVTPIAAGNATIKATSNSDNTKFGSCVVTVVLGGALSVTLDNFYDTYRWSPENVLFTGTMNCEQGAIQSIDIYLSDKTTKVLNNMTMTSNTTWRQWVTVQAGIYQFVAKITTTDGRIAWSSERLLIISPNYVFAFASSGDLYMSPSGFSAVFSFYESMPSGTSNAAVYKNVIYAHKNTNGKISYKNVEGGTWTEDSAVLLNVKSYNIYRDNMAYAYTYDGKLYKKSILVANSAWILIDSVANTGFATVGCDNFTAYGIKNTGELWTKDLTTVGSAWTFNSYISYNGSRLTSVTAITILENLIAILDQGTSRVYTKSKGGSTWSGFNSNMSDFVTISYN